MEPVGSEPPAGHRRDEMAARRVGRLEFTDGTSLSYCAKSIESRDGRRSGIF